MKSRFKWFHIVVLFLWYVTTGCDKFLDASPNKSIVVPKSIADAQALLDNSSLMNAYYPSVGDQCDGDIYVTENNFKSLTSAIQANYTWAKDARMDNNWNYLYQIVYNANVAMETLESVVPDALEMNDWQQAKGCALFIRAWAMLHLAEYFATPYRLSEKEELGIPLKLTSDPTEKVVRPSLEETYEQVIADLGKSLILLPTTTSFPTRPNKEAAMAALARVYLFMGKYDSAYHYASKGLEIDNSLLDYKDLDQSSRTPFPKFNKEVLFHCVYMGTGILSYTQGNIDSALYASYEPDDLRKGLFFLANANNAYGFKGNYSGVLGSSHFNGLGIDELYLTHAEAACRLGETEVAIEDINQLLSKRYRVWQNMTTNDFKNADSLLSFLLLERRKELVQRGIRWFDLRRLNTTSETSIVLHRNIGSQSFSLSPNDLRYTFPIPESVILENDLVQNPR